MRRLAQRVHLPSRSGLNEEGLDQAIVRESDAGKQLGQQLGLEVVRMMLENLMQDERLLPKVRELIQALEPVLMSLSQSDPRFFSERQHPARQFLDRITHQSLAYTSENDQGFSRFLLSTVDAVTTVTREGGDATSFTRELLKLEAGWFHDENAQRQKLEDGARALLHAEHRNLLAQRLCDDFSERHKIKKVPELVQSFLCGPWAQVVAQSQLGCVEGRTDPDGYLALVDDLLWSVQLRLVRRNRIRLVQLVPNLLLKLRQGLHTIQYPEERIAVFFEGLITLHEQVLDGRRVPPTDAPVKQASTEIEIDRIVEESGSLMASDAGDSSAFWVAEDEALESGYLPEDADEQFAPVQSQWQVGDLRTGMWVELMVKDAWLRAQLTWASPHRTLFMFVSHGGQAHSMSRRTMDRLRMQGWIRVLSDGHVVDNALDAVAQAALQNDLGKVGSKS